MSGPTMRDPAMSGPIVRDSSTAVSTPATLADEHPVLTPTMRTRLRRGLFWVSLAVFGVLIALLVFGMFGAANTGSPLAPDNAAPDGARAAAQVLRAQGVDVREAASLDEARDAASGPSGTTLLLHDAHRLLDEERLREAAALADRVVLLEPDALALQVLAPGVTHGGSVEGVLDADCAVRATTNAGRVTGDGAGYRLAAPDAADSASGTAEPRVTECLGSGDGVFSLVQLEHADGRTVTVLGTTTALRNDAIAFEGNAALLFTLLGQSDTLVWYQPGTADVAASEVPISDLLPRWVTPLPFALLVLVVAAGIWRGRRFGPLVVERLPVTVRAGETMEGRARLYEQSSARTHALDALRVGTVGRLAERCGLASTATVDEICTTVAALIGAPLTQVRALLVEREPGSDRELVELSDALLELEARVERATAPA